MADFTVTLPDTVKLGYNEHGYNEFMLKTKYSLIFETLFFTTVITNFVISREFF
jgi:hypothetical protein